MRRMKVRMIGSNYEMDRRLVGPYCSEEGNAMCLSTQLRLNFSIVR
jgi:hypothetical protein